MFPVFLSLKVVYNINSNQGGSASLLLQSCHFGGKGEESNSEAFLICGGVDCNQYSTKSLQKDNDGCRGPQNWFETNEKGNLFVYALHGHNHSSVLTNDSRYGNLRQCVYVKGEDGSPTALPLNINGNHAGEKGAGLTLIICSAGNGDGALYLVRSGLFNNLYRSKLLEGEDKFVFSENCGVLHVSGPSGSNYAICHNRSNLAQNTVHAYVAQKQSFDGTTPVMLCDKVPSQAAFTILCSNSKGTEDMSTASMYFVIVNKGKVVVTKEIGGMHYKVNKSSDLWTFEVTGKNLMVKGPEGPCRYGLISNLSATPQELKSTLQQKGCLVTGETSQTTGTVSITQENVSGEINKKSPIHIQWNLRKLAIIPENEMKKSANGFTFSYNWPAAEKVVGHHLIRVFAARKHVKSKHLTSLNCNILVSSLYICIQR